MSDVKLTLRYRDNQSGEGLVCNRCRNSNQNTDDYREGLVFCKFGMGIKYDNHPCDINVSDRLLFEEYDGTNCTWYKDGQFEVVVED